MGKSVDMEVSQLLPWGTGINLEDNSTRWEKSGSLKNCGVQLHFDAEPLISRQDGEKEQERKKTLLLYLSPIFCVSLLISSLTKQLKIKISVFYFKSNICEP
jgi:hypothetical protein